MSQINGLRNSYEQRITQSELPSSRNTVSAGDEQTQGFQRPVEGLPSVASPRLSRGSIDESNPSIDRPVVSQRGESEDDVEMWAAVRNLFSENEPETYQYQNIDKGHAEHEVAEDAEQVVARILDPLHLVAETYVEQLKTAQEASEHVGQAVEKAGNVLKPLGQALGGLSVAINAYKIGSAVKTISKARKAVLDERGVNERLDKGDLQDEQIKELASHFKQ